MATVQESARFSAASRARGWCAASLLLRRNDRRQLRTPAIVRLRTGDGLRPGRLVGRVAGEEGRNGWKIVGVVGSQSPNPGEAADVHRHLHR